MKIRRDDMKKAVLLTILALGIASTFSACEKPDYQDPRYRSSHSK